MNARTVLFSLSLVFTVLASQAHAKGQRATNVLPEPAGAPVIEKSYSSGSSGGSSVDGHAAAVNPTRIPPIDDALDGWIEENAERFGLYLDNRPRKSPGAVSVTPEAHEASTDTARASRVRSTPPMSIREITPEEMKPQPDDIEKLYLNSLTALPEMRQQADGSYAPVDKKIFAPPAAAVKTVDPAVQIAAVMEDMKFGTACEKFANDKGYGPYGKLIVDELMSGRAESVMNATDDVRRACPNYDYLNHYEKASVWVKVIASMSFLESTCDEKSGIKKRVQAVNGAAAGLTQLHRDQEGKYGDECSNGDSRSPLKTLRCTVSMLNGQIERTGALLSSKSYWAVLRPQGEKVTTKKGEKKTLVKARVIIGGLKELPLCQRPTTAKTSPYTKRDDAKAPSMSIGAWVRSKITPSSSGASNTGSKSSSGARKTAR